MALVLTALGFIVLALVAAQLVVELFRVVRRMASDWRADRVRMQQLVREVRQLEQSHESGRRHYRGWEGIRKFRVSRKIAECQDCHSFYLVPHDGRELPPFLPGQYLTFVLRIPGQDKPVVRCYSLSEQPRRDYYRCTIKKINSPPQHPQAPPGVASTYFTDLVQEGMILDVKAPRGGFHLDAFSERPIVLIAGGVGVTPLISMLNSVVSTATGRSVVLFLGVRHGRQHLFKRYLATAQQQHDNLTVVTCYSAPRADDILGDDYNVAGRISPELIKQHLPSNNYEFYVCGPGTFMQDMLAWLHEWGVPDSDIHYETFGPSTLGKKHLTTSVERSASVNVRFERSGKDCSWDTACTSLLDLAEANSVEIESGCRAGNCGTCLTAIKSGTVEYLEEPDELCDEGSCLPCICVPKEAVTLDA